MPEISTGVVADAVRPIDGAARPQVRGKFIYVGDEKLHLRGVTYGPFRPGPDGCEYGDRERVERDFAVMAEHGINAVRTYTAPPRWLLDIAAKQGLRVMVGLAWEQHVAFLDEAGTRRRIERSVRDGVAACAGHPAVLCYAIGNEIPGPIVRYSGPRRVERFLHRLYRIAKAQDREALVTYVNFPTTEYLQLPFLDFLAYNVYLEEPEKLTAYLARLQNQAGDRPVVMAEVGLDSLRNGEQAQAETLDWQIRTAFAEGVAGLFVFSWTDEWHRGGQDIDDWAFGLTDRARQAKPALEQVAASFAATPFAPDGDWPGVSVVLCTYNGALTIRETCQRLTELDYPDYEVIVVDDGSTDQTPRILEDFPGFRVLRTANGGLSRARNQGMAAARGEIVAYIDDDAWPDPHWLRYLVHRLRTSDHVAVGGPNLPPQDDPWVARCVAHSPGGPNHVLLDDRTAEHIPGCNMAFWKRTLAAIGGFDERFHTAGDDVDICWRLQERGGTIGYHGSALVWHRRRPSLRRYLRQQRAYGRAEAMLEAKWPEKYNGLGHVVWHGELYGQGIAQPLRWRRWRVYHGVWGSAPFQRVYPRPLTLAQCMPLMPEWYLLIVALMFVSVPGLIWQPLLLAVPLLALAVGVPLAQSMVNALRAPIRAADGWQAVRQRAVIGLMHQLQPMVRLWGRLTARRGQGRLSRWRLAWPGLRRDAIVEEHWRSAEQRLEALETALRQAGVRVSRGGEWDRHDLELRLGMLSTARVAMAVEEHGGWQMVRLRCWPVLAPTVVGLVLATMGLASLAWLWQSYGAAAVLAAVALSLLVRAAGDAAAVMSAYREVVRPPAEQVQEAA